MQWGTPHHQSALLSSNVLAARGLPAPGTRSLKPAIQILAGKLHLPELQPLYRLQTLAASNHHGLRVESARFGAPKPWRPLGWLGPDDFCPPPRSMKPPNESNHRLSARS